jgi:hypothetical protein
MGRFQPVTTVTYRPIVLKKSMLISSTILVDWFWIDAHVDWLESFYVGGCEPLSQH